jgi:hypothetical protein
MKKLIRDTMMENGEYSMKRVSAFTAFWIAQLYIVAVHIWDWKVMEFVYEWLMGWSFLAVTGTVVDKKLMNKANIFNTMTGGGTVQKETVEKTTTTTKVDGKKTDDIG